MTALMQIGFIVLGRYEVQDIIANGGEGLVAKGVDLLTGPQVAIKQLDVRPSDPHYVQQVARLKRAGELRVGHRCIVEAIEYGEENGYWYLVMPFVEGVDLELHVRACGGQCSAEQALPILLELTDGLAALHARGVVHRDIKPRNIIVQPDGLPTLVDLGICHLLSEATVSGGGTVGTPCWMSPEQTRDPTSVDPRSDLFCLGLVGYYMLTGTPPVQASDPHNAARLIRECSFPPLRQLNPAVPQYLAQACSRLVAPRPEDRFQSARDLKQFLEQGDSAISAAGYCAACGEPAQEKDLFCADCGAPLGNPTPQLLCLACGASVGESPKCPACSRPFSSSGHQLAFDAGPLAGKVFRIPEGIYDVGRDQLEPRDFGISRRHFHVACSNGAVHVQDAGSANKTYISGLPADRPIQLHPQQEFLIVGNHAVYHSQ